MASAEPPVDSPVEPSAPAPRTAAAKTRTISAIAFTIFFVGTLAATILGKLTAIHAPIYPFSMTILSPIAGLIVYPLVVLGLWRAGYLPKAARQVPWWKAAIVGALFCTHNVLQNLGNRGNVVPGPIALILFKSIVPVTFTASYFVKQLNPQYKWSHYTAVMLLLAGICMTLGSSLGSLQGFSFSESAWYMTLLVISVFPLAAAFIFIEVQLKRQHRELHPTFLWAYICIFEAIASIPLAFVNAALQDLPTSQVVSNTADGMACLVLGSPSGPFHTTTSHGLPVTVDCGVARTFYLAALIPGFALNFAMPFCAKYGSATMLWFVRAFALPVSSILFAVRAIMGKYAATLSGWEWGGLVIVFAANVMYNWQSTEPVPPPKDKDPRMSSAEFGLAPTKKLLMHDSLAERAAAEV